MFGIDIGSFKDILQRNPLEYGDALGLTHGPLSGRAPGKLTDQGLDYQSKINPFVSRGKLETANDVAPFVAAAIATFGGSAAPSAGSSPAVMGGANSEVGSLAGGTGGSAASSSPAWLKYMRMGQMGSSLLGGMGGQQQQMMQPPMQPHTQPQGLLGGYPGYSYQPLTSAPGLLGRQMMMGPNLFGGG